MKVTVFYDTFPPATGAPALHIHYDKGQKRKAPPISLASQAYLSYARFRRQHFNVVDCKMVLILEND